MVKCSDAYYKKVVNQDGISHFYRFRQKEDLNQIETSVPDGCTDIIFSYDADKSHIGVNLYGSPLMPRTFDMTPGYYYFGVRFLPGNLPMVTGVNMADAVNSVIPLGGKAKQQNLAELIGSKDSFENQIEIFMDFYRRNLDDELSLVKNYELKKYLVSSILSSNGSVRIEELANSSGYSVRYVNRMFKSEMGIPPKEFCRIIRFQKCMSDMCSKYRGCEDMDLGMLSMDLGYADESHMIRDFKEYTNRTPHAFWSELGKFQYLNRLKFV